MQLMFMNNLFLLENSTQIAATIIDSIRNRLPLNVIRSSSLQEARALFAESSVEFEAAVVDLELPDATYLEILQFLRDQKLSAIIITRGIDDELRRGIWEYGIIDYLIKHQERSIEYLVSIVDRLCRNPSVKVLIVDDSKIMRLYFGGLLRNHRYHVLLAKSGEEGLQMFEEHPDIKLVLLDYLMTGMDGIDLTVALRRTYPKEELSIIALSGQDKEEVSAQFIKSGANDYIDKRMSKEGFYCRISHQIEMLENIQLLRESGYRDFLTGLYNRRYFFDVGRAMHAAAIRAGNDMVLAMLDIDHFKKINDTYGHDTGDLVIRDLAQKMLNRFRKSDIVARFGGEEFCVLLNNTPSHEAEKIFDALRQAVSCVPLECGFGSVGYTVSIGVCSKRHDDLESMISKADELLYKAKNSGRNQVECGE